MRYRIGWEEHGNWHYLIAYSREDMLTIVADKSAVSDKLNITQQRGVDLDGTYAHYTLRSTGGNIVCYKATSLENAIARAKRTFGDEWELLKTRKENANEVHVKAVERCKG